jgi:hypothetical protein
MENDSLMNDLNTNTDQTGMLGKVKNWFSREELNCFKVTISYLPVKYFFKPSVEVLFLIDCLRQA